MGKGLQNPFTQEAIQTANGCFKKKKKASNPYDSLGRRKLKLQ